MQNKHIIRFCFLGIFFIIIANIILYRQFIVEEAILHEISYNNKLLIKTYEDNILELFPKVVKKLRHNKDDTLFSSPEFLEFIKHTTKFFQSSDILTVQIFDSDENELFKSNNIHIDFDKNPIETFFELIESKLDYILSKDLIDRGILLSWVEIKDKNQKSKKAHIIVENIHIVSKDNAPYLEFVIYRDITSLWKEMCGLEYKIFLAFFLLFSVLFVIIIYNTRYAQNMINKQFQVNKLLAEAKRKAENESTAKTQFLANVSHELRTPLNAIIGFSEIILSEKNSSRIAQYIDYVNDIHISGKHLLAVINDILDYSKATAKKLQVEMIDVNLNKIAVSSMRYFEPKAKEAKITLIKDIPDESIIIKADPKRLKQALLNLLSNAVKFTPANGNVTLSISKLFKKKKVCIKIVDTGIGISAEDLPKALASFEQVDDKKDRRFEGTGLGLPLTKKLVELMKGTFTITSVIGKGTVVALYFKYEDREG